MSLIQNISKQTALPLNILLIFIVPVFLITSDVRIAFNSVMLYEYGFDKYDDPLFTDPPRSVSYTHLTLPTILLV